MVTWSFLSGAAGHFHAVELSTGRFAGRNIFSASSAVPRSFRWGFFVVRRLVAEGRLIIQPGGPEASLVALEPATGEILWKSPGRPPGHSSLVSAEFNGKKQVVGYDDHDLSEAGISVTGQRLWTLKPERCGDFNVPTPIVWDDKLIVATENNGTRIYGFDPQGLINPRATCNQRSIWCLTVNRQSWRQSSVVRRVRRIGLP